MYVRRERVQTCLETQPDVVLTLVFCSSVSESSTARSPALHTRTHARAVHPDGRTLESGRKFMSPRVRLSPAQVMNDPIPLSSSMCDCQRCLPQPSRYSLYSMYRAIGLHTMHDALDTKLGELSIKRVGFRARGGGRSGTAGR